MAIMRHIPLRYLLRKPSPIKLAKLWPSRVSAPTQGCPFKSWALYRRYRYSARLKR